MKLAFLYAGQGSQAEQMGRDFYDAYPQIKDVFHNDKAGFDIADTCFNAPLSLLSQTKYTQPCMAAFAACVTNLLFEKGIRPDYAAGLSLGEYSALYASGVFDINTLIDVLAFRGRAMESTTAGLDTKMMAVIGLDEKDVREAVAKAQAENVGIVACANFNCKGQTVIGGDSAAVERAAEFCNEAGAKRCLPLNVSAPFHTPLMEEASAMMKEKLSAINFGKMDIPVIFNATAKELQADETVAKLLEIQVKVPVLFEKTIEKLVELGVDTVVEIGPGKAIAGFIKKTAPSITVYSIEDVAGLEKTIEILGA